MYFLSCPICAALRRQHWNVIPDVAGSREVNALPYQSLLSSFKDLILLNCSDKPFSRVQSKQLTVVYPGILGKTPLMDPEIIDIKYPPAFLAGHVNGEIKVDSS